MHEACLPGVSALHSQSGALLSLSMTSPECGAGTDQATASCDRWQEQAWIWGGPGGDTRCRVGGPKALLKRRICAALASLWACRFVIKTVDKSGKKAFLNVCSSDKMPLPSNWGNDQASPHSLTSHSSWPSMQGPLHPSSLATQASTLPQALLQLQLLLILWHIQLAGMNGQQQGSSCHPHIWHLTLKAPDQTRARHAHIQRTLQVTPETKALLERLAQDGKVGPDEEAARFPMAVGEVREDRDHLDQGASVCDIILNPTILRQAQAFRHAPPHLSGSTDLTSSNGTTPRGDGVAPFPPSWL